MATQKANKGDNVTKKKVNKEVKSKDKNNSTPQKQKAKQTQKPETKKVQQPETKKNTKSTPQPKQQIEHSTKSLKRKTEDTQLDNTDKPKKHHKVELKTESPTQDITVLPTSKTIQKIGDYYAIPYKFTDNGAIRHLLVKHDNINNVLRITNMSLGVDEDTLKQMFSDFEPSAVSFSPLSLQTSVPEAVLSISNLDAVLDTLEVPVVLDDNKIPTLDSMVKGKKKAQTARQVLKGVDDFMFQYDANLGNNTTKRPALVKDSEGFKVATSRINLVGSDSTSRKEKSIEMLQKKEKAKQLTNFYKFQRVEQFQNKQAEQNKKLENDKKRIALMVKQQKFKALLKS